MSIRSKWTSCTARQAWRLFWGQRSVREQRLLAIMGAVLFLLLLWQSGAALVRERSRLQHRLPQLEQELQLRQAMAKEWTELKAHPALVMPDGDATDWLHTSAQAQGLNLEIRREGDRWLLTGQVNFDAWVAWLGTLQQQQGLRVARLESQSGAEGVLVRAELQGAPH